MPPRSLRPRTPLVDGSAGREKKTRVGRDTGHCPKRSPRQSANTSKSKGKRKKKEYTVHYVRTRYIAFVEYRTCGGGSERHLERVICIRHTNNNNDDAVFNRVVTVVKRYLIIDRNRAVRATITVPSPSTSVCCIFFSSSSADKNRPVSCSVRPRGSRRPVPFFARRSL